MKYFLRFWRRRALKPTKSAEIDIPIQLLGILLKHKLYGSPLILKKCVLPFENASKVVAVGVFPIPPVDEESVVADNGVAQAASKSSTAEF